ncbi:hypothetical protein MTR_1g034970 [Medicago truncatula]|uniref:Uncharacterized protein n=1 Tax=Medicago truncatula TaxID=3880 RepID=G7IA19_MEDTR|nr:hypothetical protein MTR_1g034970 [Medicago truncatula]
MVEIDPDFIQPQIPISPILDDSNNVQNPLSFDELVRKIGSACKEWGFICKHCYLNFHRNSCAGSTHTFCDLASIESVNER